jgi:hypothetical protein
VLRKLILGFVLAWSLLGFLYEVRDGLDGIDHRRDRPVAPELWHLGSSQTERLRTCLTAVREAVPAGSYVVFVSPPGPSEAEFYRWRWAAYLLPDLHVLPLDSPETPRLAQYLVDYRRRFEHPWLGEMRQLPGCRLFTVRRP